MYVTSVRSLPRIALRFRKCLTTACVAAVTATTVPAFGQTTPAQIEAMQRQIEALTRDLNAMKQAMAKESADVKKELEQQPILKIDNGRPTIRSRDGNFVAGLTGRIHFDGGGYIQEKQPLPDRRAVADLNDGTAFRRLNLGMLGTVFKDWDYVVSLDFSGGGSPEAPTLDEAYLAYMGWRPLTIRAGAFSPPQTFEDTVSSNDIVFMERPSAVSIATGVAAGSAREAAGLQYYGERWFAGAYYTGASYGTGDTTDQQAAGVGRLAGLVLKDADYNLHLGASGSHVFRPNGGATGAAAGARSTIQLRDRPELRIDHNRLIDTGAVPSDGAHVWGLEVAANWRNLQVQGEYLGYHIDTDRLPPLASPDLDFHGYYGQVSWLITGETRPYSISKAAYGGVRPARPFSLNGGGGAWELAYRYSYVNLNDKDVGGVPIATSGGVRGGEQKIHTVGVNWYVNNNVRFMLNYLHVDVDRLNAAGTTPIGDEYDAVAMRAQLSW